MQRWAALVSIILGASVAACGSESTAAPSDHAPGRPDLVLQIRTGSGAWDHKFPNVPRFTLYGDGTFIHKAAETAVSPVPALPTLVTGRLAEADVHAARAAARGAGVAGSPDLGMPRITDQGSTSFVLVDGGRTHRVAA